MTACFFSACTMYETPPFIAGDNKEEEIKTTFDRKVLWINIDGAKGSVVKNNIPANIAAMLPQSKYTFDGLSEARTLESEFAEDAVGWTTMLTGVIPGKHKIRGHSYKPEVVLNVSDQTEKVTYFPTALNYIMDAYPKKKILCVTPWENLNVNMLNNAYLTVTSPNDESTFNTVLESLSDDYILTMLSFSGMYDAGKNGGFSSSNSAYSSALNTIDGYIGQLRVAIEQRPTYDDEDWLIVISSNHSGLSDGHFGGDSDEERNNIGIFYYAHASSSKEFQGDAFFGAYFDPLVTAQAIDTLQNYLAGANDTMAIEVILSESIRSNGTHDHGGSWGKMIGKNAFSIYKQHNASSILRYNGASGSIQTSVSSFNDSFWHSFLICVAPNESKQMTSSIFYDGELKSGPTLSSAIGVESDSSNFTISSGSIVIPFYLAEVRVWNTILPNEVISELGSELNIPSTHPYYKNLTGYWKFTDPSAVINDTIVRNEIPGKPDMIANSRLKFGKIANSLYKYRKTGEQQLENIQFLPQVLYWLQIPVPSTVDGVLFLNNYATDELWRDKVEY
jgi:hypothetical protein